MIVSNHGDPVLDTAVATAGAARNRQAIGIACPCCWSTVESVAAPTCSGHRPGCGCGTRRAPRDHAVWPAPAHGVARATRLLRDELEIAMALCGCARIGDITRDIAGPRRGRKRH